MESNRQIRSCRTRTIDGLSNSPLDVLVVGGGIVGAGIVRDAAMRGLRLKQDRSMKTGVVGLGWKR